MESAMSILNMSVFDFISAVTFFLGVAISVVTFAQQNHSQKRAVTLHMHNIWNSEGLRRSRREGFALAESVRIAKIPARTLSALQANSLLDIKQFFADLNQLLEVGALDKKLAKQLFGAAAMAWFDEVLLKLDYDDDSTGHQSNSFFQTRVLPLKSKLAA
jgi:hypothetical protein